MMWYEGACLYYVDETFHMSIIVLLLHDPYVDKARGLQKSLLLWLLLGEYGYYPIAHHFLNHALDFNDMLQQEKACINLFHLRKYGHHMTSPMSMCFALCKIWHIDLMMCIDDNNLYWDDVTYHMSISMGWFHDAHEEERGQQGPLLLWLLLNEYSDHPIAHHFLIHALYIKDKLH